jgi:hypothetical protein
MIWKSGRPVSSTEVLVPERSVARRGCRDDRICMKEKYPVGIATLTAQNL